MTTWPQYTFLALYCMSIGVALAKQKDIIFTLISTIGATLVLYKGGFFVSLGWAP